MELSIDSHALNKSQTLSYKSLLEEITVSKWIDDSKKYKMGYILTNGFSGIIFKDFSTMMIDNTGK